MNRNTIILVTLSLYFSPATEVQPNSEHNADAPTIEITKLDIIEKALKLNYEIRNESEHSIWLCDGINLFFMGFGIGMAEDSQTLIVSRLLSASKAGSGPQILGRYVRIRAGENRKESLLLSLPISPSRVVWRSGRVPDDHNGYSKRLVIELGWYAGDFPDKVFGMLDEAEKKHLKAPYTELGIPLDVIGWLGDSVRLNRLNESVPDRNEQLLIPWTDRTLKGEHILRVSVDDVHIPYTDETMPARFGSQKLNLCTRIEITYRPSMLEYLFSYPSQRTLLNADEVEYLQCQKKVVINEVKSIKALVDEIGKGYRGGYFVSGQSKTAYIECYTQEKFLMCFTAYDDKAIVTKEGQCFWYQDVLQSVKLLTAQTKQASPFTLRVKCAANIGKLWHRLHLYHKAKQMRYTNEGIIKVVEPIPPEYPAPDQWCDRLVKAYVPLGGNKAYIIGVHKCPGAGVGRNHYAMNPNCKPDSPPDMVLLFETKAGWNQHGGPELFTFDNHDPKGGCVLLNDGTVKFIRTKQELQQLRWK